MSGAPRAACTLVHHACPVQAAFLVSATFPERNPLGYPAESARPRITRRLHGVATPALVGMAAAFALAYAPASAHAATQAPVRHPAATQAAGQPAATPAWLASL